jgi:hypothetical protein
VSAADTPSPDSILRTLDGRLGVVMVLKSVALFMLAAVLEIGGAWLVWQGVREPAD